MALFEGHDGQAELFEHLHVGERGFGFHGAQRDGFGERTDRRDVNGVKHTLRIGLVDMRKTDYFHNADRFETFVRMIKENRIAQRHRAQVNPDLIIACTVPDRPFVADQVGPAIFGRFGFHQPILHSIVLPARRDASKALA